VNNSESELLSVVKYIIFENRRQRHKLRLASGYVRKNSYE